MIPQWAELTADELSDLAILGARIKDGGYADDRKPMGYHAMKNGVEVVTPWRIAMEVEG